MSDLTTHSIQLRPWLAGDSPALAAISNLAGVHTSAHFRCSNEGAAQWESRLGVTGDCHPCLVAVLKGHPVGYAAGQAFSGGCGFAGVAETSVYVHPDHHGERLATRLYEALIPLLAAQGYRRLFASITAPNPASERLHERFGFRRVGVLARVGWKFDRWHDVGYWQRDLVESDAPPVAIRPAREAWAEVTGRRA